MAVRGQLMLGLMGLALAFAPQAQAKGRPAKVLVCDPMRFGAKADGVTKDTKAIQNAIDDCAGKGGGTVRLNKGVFLSAPITLKSNVTLFLAKGATLKGSPDHGDYPAMEVFRAKGRQSLISSLNAHDIAITGGGVINGNGISWWKNPDGSKPNSILGQGDFRPRLIVFDHSRRIRLTGVTVENSPSWQIVPYYSDDVVISGIKVLAPADSPNTDAIDPFASSHVTITHVYADVGDDNVAIKSGAINSPGPDSPASDITITDCTFVHGHGLSIGSELAGGARNIRASHISFDSTDYGIRIKANRDRGNDVGKMSFSDLTMKNIKTAILITEYYPGTPPESGNTAKPVTRLTPRFHDISITNVTSTGGGTAGAIYGLPESPVTNVRLTNVRLSAQKGFTIADARVTLSRVKVTAKEGKAMDVRSSAKVSGK